MAYYENLPIYKKTMELAIFFENVVRKFSRYNKYAIGAELRSYRKTDILWRNGMKILTGVLGILLFCGVAWAGDYTDNLNGTVTDNGTGLIWQQEDDNTTRTWEAAISYCEGLSLAGETDWRLPNMKELESIIDDSRNNPAIDIKAFPNTNSSNYWSSTTPKASYTFYAWVVNFYSGSVSYYGNVKTNGMYVRCV